MASIATDGHRDDMEALRPLLIAGLVLTEVGIWQWRMVIAHRGSRATAMLLGVIGAVLQITAITQVVAGVHDPLSIAAYAGGVGFGVLFGLVAGDRLTPGAVGVTIVTSCEQLARRLWELGWPATAQPGHGAPRGRSSSCSPPSTGVTWIACTAMCQTSTPTRSGRCATCTRCRCRVRRPKPRPDS
jgi:hypothetical protein